MATHSGILAWKIPWTKEPGDLVMGLQRVRHNITHTHTDGLCGISLLTLPHTPSPLPISFLLSNVLPSLCHLSKFELSSRASLVAQRLKHLPGMQETWVQSLGREDPLEKEMATHSSILAWRIHGGRSLIGYSPRGDKE